MGPYAKLDFEKSHSLSPQCVSALIKMCIFSLRNPIHFLTAILQSQRGHRPYSLFDGNFANTGGPLQVEWNSKQNTGPIHFLTAILQTQGDRYKLNGTACKIRIVKTTPLITKKIVWDLVFTNHISRP